LARRSETPVPAGVADRIHSAALHLLRRLRRQDEAMGITAARASALSVAVFAGPVTLGRLAQAEQVSAPTMTRLIVGMEEEGLVKREADPADRRVVWIRPTAKGTRLLTEGRRRRVEALTRDLAALDPVSLSVLAQAAEILDGVARAADIHAAASSRPASENPRTGGGRRGRRRFV
jgi:DNA-binding MarR family transcriptional regulator